jgi:hypothetical protein
MSGKSMATWITVHVARGLVKGPMPSVITAGTFALAGFAGAALTAQGQHVQSSPTVPPGLTAPAYNTANCYPDPDGDGHLVCHIDRSQLPSYNNGNCYADPDGDGHLVCYVNPQ